MPRSSGRGVPGTGRGVAAVPSLREHLLAYAGLDLRQTADDTSLTSDAATQLKGNARTASDSLFGVNNYSATILAYASLVSYWKLGEAPGATSAVDAVSALNGTYVTGSWTLGNTGLQTGDADTSFFNSGGSGGGVDIGAQSALRTANITVAAWVKSSVTYNGFTGTIFRQGGSTLNNGYRLYFGGSRDASLHYPLIFSVYDSGGVAHTIQTTTGYTDGLPHFVVAAFDGATLTLYVDGVAVTPVSFAGAISYDTTSVGAAEIGRRASGGNSDVLDGSVEKVAVFNAALVQSDVNTLWAAGSTAGGDAATRTLSYLHGGSDTSLSTDAATRLVAAGRTASDTTLTSDSATGAAHGAPKTAADTSLTSDGATRRLVVGRTGSDTTATTDAATRTSSRPRTTTDNTATQDEWVNFLLNPSFELDAIGAAPAEWNDGGVAGVTDNRVRGTWSASGAKSLHMNISTTGANEFRQYLSPFDSRAPRTAPGEVWTVIAEFNVVSVTGATTVVRFGLGAMNSAFASIGQLVTSIGVGSSRVAVALTMPANAAGVFVNVVANGGATPPGSAEFYVDSIMLLRGDWTAAPPTYFDGDTAGARWLGTTEDSASSKPSATRSLSLPRPISDTSATSDGATATRGLVLARSASDTSTTTDSATRLGSFGRSASDTSATTDSATRVLRVARTAADTSATSDSATRNLALGRSASDTSASSDTATRTLRVSRTAADTTANSDAAARTLSVARSASDTSAASDSATGVVHTPAATAADTSLTSDSATRALSLSRSGSDTSATSDSAARGLVVSRSASDTSATTDTATRTLRVSRTAADISASSDAATRALSLARTASDTAATTDAATRNLIVSRTASDTSASSDAATRLLAVARSATDTSATTDSATRVLRVARTAADTDLTVDSATRAPGFGRLMIDTSLTSDTATRLLVLPRSTADTSLASDSATRTARFSRSASDATVTTDSATRAAFTRGRTASDVSLTNEGGYTDTFDTLDPSWTVIDYSGGARTATADGQLHLPGTGDLWDTADNAVVALRPTKGGGAWSAEVDVISTGETSYPRLFGARGGTGASAVNVTILANNDATRLGMMRRQNAAGGSEWDNATAPGVAIASTPFRLRIEASADQLTATGKVSFDGGGSWSTIGSYSVTSPLVVPELVSTSDGSNTTAVYDNYVESGAAQRVVFLPRATSDSSATSDSATRVRGPARTASDTSATSDAATRQLRLFRTTAEDSSSTVDAIRGVAVTRTTSDTSATADAATRAYFGPRTAADTSATTDSATRVARFARSASDVTTCADAASRSNVLPRSTADASLSTDSATRTERESRSATDTSLVSDTADAQRRLSRTASDASATADASTRQLSLFRTTGDSSAASDAATRAFTGSFTAADISLSLDAASRGVFMSRSAADTSLTADVVTRLLRFARSAADESDIDDSARSQPTHHLEASDESLTDDVAARALRLTRAAFDVSLTADSVFDIPPPPTDLPVYLFLDPARRVLAMRPDPNGLALKASDVMSIASGAAQLAVEPRETDLALKADEVLLPLDGDEF